MDRIHLLWPSEAARRFEDARDVIPGRSQSGETESGRSLDAWPRMKWLSTSSVLISFVGALPVYLVSSVGAVEAGQHGLGLGVLTELVFSYYGGSCVGLVAAVAAARRWPATRAVVMATGVFSLGCGVLARTGGHGALGQAGMVSLGLGAAWAQIALNAVIVEQAPGQHLDAAFGLKQAAFPLAALAAGVTAALARGESAMAQSLYVVAASAVVVVIVLAAKWQFGQGPRRVGLGFEGHEAPFRNVRLYGMVLAVAVGSVGSAGMTTYLGKYAVAAGLSATASGALYTLGAATAVLVRVGLGAGYHCESPGSGFKAVSLIIAIGAVGDACFCFTQVPALIAGAIVGFGAGLGWAGVLLVALAKQFGTQIVAASAMSQFAMYVGSAGGPWAFYAVERLLDYRDAWSMAAVACLLSAATLWKLTVGEEGGLSVVSAK